MFKSVCEFHATTLPVVADEGPLEVVEMSGDRILQSGVITDPQ
jgi:hypothetical protein